MSIRRPSAGTAAAHEAAAERSVAPTRPPSFRTRSRVGRYPPSPGARPRQFPQRVSVFVPANPRMRAATARHGANPQPGPPLTALPTKQKTWTARGRCASGATARSPTTPRPARCLRTTDVHTSRLRQEHDAQNETHRGSRSARNAEIPERGAARKDHRHPDADGRGRHHPRAGVDGVLLVFDRAELARLFFAVAVVGVLALARRRRGDGKSVLLVAHGILVAVCGIALIDAPIAWVPRSAHMFLLPLAAAAAFIFEARERYGLSLRRSTSTDRSPRPGRSGR